MVEVDVEARGTRRTSRRMRWWRRTKRHGSRRDTGGVKGEERENERDRDRARRGRTWTKKKKKIRKKKKRTKKKRMKKKGLIQRQYTHGAAQTAAKLRSFALFDFANLYLEGQRSFAALAAAPARKRKEERRREVLGYARGLSFSLSLSLARDGPREISRPRESHEMATLATIAFVPCFFYQLAVPLFVLFPRPSVTDDFFFVSVASLLSYVDVSDLDLFGSTGSKYRCRVTSLGRHGKKPFRLVRITRELFVIHNP